MPIWTTPLQRARQDDRNGHLIRQLWNSYEKDIKGIIKHGMLMSS
jgi:hypothetical protein